MSTNEQRAQELLEIAMGCAVEHNLSGLVSMPAALDAIAAALRSAQGPQWRPEDTLLLQAISAQLRRAGNVVQAKHIDRAVAALSPNGGEHG